MVLGGFNEPRQKKKLVVNKKVFSWEVDFYFGYLIIDAALIVSDTNTQLAR